MAKRFLHISFDFADADPQVEKLQPVFDKAIDWLRYMPTWMSRRSNMAYSAASLLPYQRRAAASQLADRRRQSQKRYVRTA